MPQSDSNLVRIGVYYDGNFLFHVSNYYLHHHERRARISVGGLHEFIVGQVAALEGAERRRCKVVDARYYRGRLRAADAGEREALYKERVFDDVLARAGVVPRYVHVTPGGEKGVDVLLALEALEAALDDKIDVLALMAADGDFQPLVRKLQARGVRVLLLAWDLHYSDHHGADRETRTATALIEEACYPVPMHSFIEERGNAAAVQQLFVARRDAAPSGDGPAPPSNSGPAPRAGFRSASPPPPPPAPLPPPTGPLSYGAVDAIRNGYGFIHPEDGGPNLFFLYQEVLGSAFADLCEGDSVAFIAGMNERGPCARAVRKVEAEANDAVHDDEADDRESDGFGRGLHRDDGSPPDALSEVQRYDDDEEDVNGNR